MIQPVDHGSQNQALESFCCCDTSENEELWQTNKQTLEKYKTKLVTVQTGPDDCKANKH